MIKLILKLYKKGDITSKIALKLIEGFNIECYEGDESIEYAIDCDVPGNSSLT